MDFDVAGWLYRNQAWLIALSAALLWYPIFRQGRDALAAAGKPHAAAYVALVVVLLLGGVFLFVVNSGTLVADASALTH